MVFVGALAGVPQALLVAPFDKVLVDWHTTGTMKLLQKDAYKGVRGVLLKEMATGAGFFWMYTELKRAFNADHDPLIGGACGTAAATTCFVVSYPLDTVTRRLQSGQDLTAALARGRFFEGFKFGVARCLLSNFVALFMYEYVIKRIRRAEAEKALQLAVEEEQVKQVRDSRGPGVVLRLRGGGGERRRRPPVCEATLLDPALLPQPVTGLLSDLP